MSNSLKVLAQSNPSVNTLTDIYTAPANISTINSTVTICNQSSVIAKFRLSIAIAGAADAVKQYLYYDLPLSPNDTFGLTFGITLAATDVIRGYTNNSAVSFNVFGTEVS